MADDKKIDYSCVDYAARLATPNYSRPIQPLAVYTPSADPQLVKEIARLHSVVARYREAIAVTMVELDESAADSEILLKEDVDDIEKRFQDVLKFYEGVS
jgi:hypothetical protein